MKKAIVSAVTIISLMLQMPYGMAFTRITDLVINGGSFDPANLDTIRNGKKGKNRTLKNQEVFTEESSGTSSTSGGTTQKKPKVAKPQTVKAFQAKPKEIQFEIDNSTLLVKSTGDVQLPITSSAFYNAVQESIDLWNGVEFADMKILSPKFTTSMMNPNDGLNLISAKTDIPPEGFSGGALGSRVFTVTSIAKTNSVVFNGETIMVKPGTLLDVDTIFDPSNNPCSVFFTTTGDIKIGGDPQAPIGEGGVDNILAEKTCDNKVSGNDVTNSATIALGRLLGLDTSALVSSATAEVGLNMLRYALTPDDEIGLANIYPKVSKLKERGKFSGKVTLNKSPVLGAHVVLENKDTGEVTAGTITDINGSFEIINIPQGDYIAYAEPLDGAIRAKKFDPQSFFPRNADLNFTTGVADKVVSINAGKETRVIIPVRETTGSAFNINPKMFSLFTTKEVDDIGGHAVSPISISPGETITDLEFWGINLDDGFGTLTVSGEGCTVNNVANKSVRISDERECADCEDPVDEEPADGIPDGPPCNRNLELCSASQEVVKQADELPGITADITCAADALPGPRNIIYTADKLDAENPNFGLRDQISGGLIVRE
jgi:hypothetical protein